MIVGSVQLIGTYPIRPPSLFDQCGSMHAINVQVLTRLQLQRATKRAGVVLLKMIDDVPACHHSVVIGLSRRRFVVVHLASVALQYPEPSTMLVVNKVIPRIPPEFIVIRAILIDTRSSE